MLTPPEAWTPLIAHLEQQSAQWTQQMRQELAAAWGDDPTMGEQVRAAHFAEFHVDEGGYS